MYHKNASLAGIGTAIGSLIGSVTKPINSLAKNVNSLIDPALNAAIQYKNIQSVLRGGTPIYSASPTFPGYAPTVPPTLPGYALPGGTGERLPSPLTRAEISTLQEMLNAIGYSAGPIDGIYGPLTAGGVSAFQRASRLPADGKATRDVYEAVTAAYYARPYEIAPIDARAPTARPAAPVPVAMAGMPAWLIPVALGGVGLFLLTQRRGR